MRPRFVACTALLALLFAPALLPSAARAWTYGDTLTTVMRPLPNLPVILRPGDSLTVWALASSGATGWTATLRFASYTRALTAAGGGYDAGLTRWVLRFRVPEGTPEELYDLIVGSSATTPDTSRHSVKVIPAYRTDYYFAQISDTHLPEHTFSSNGQINTADTTGMADFDAVIDDLNAIHPEFILHTGDLVNEGELEEYLGMYEMGRAGQMLSRLRDPVFVVSGNHDQGGWKPTPPPDGTARKNWWRHFGWPWLLSPPAGDPWHSQDYSFDYGLLHCIGLEAYINNGSYDSYRTDLWGAQSMTPEQMSWLAQDVAAVPGGHFKLAFFHYDFGGTLGNGSPAPNFSQFNNPTALGLNGVIWGHNHGVAEGNRTAQPFNLGLQSVIDRRRFRIFRVSGSTVSPGPMHASGGISTAPTDSMTLTWSGPNDGTRSSLTATVLNRFGEAWDHARLVFVMADHDSTYTASGGTIAQFLGEGGRQHVYVDCVLPAGATKVVTVSAAGPLSVGTPAGGALRLEPPRPNPFRPAAGALMLRFALPARERVRVSVFDLAGRRVATLFDGEAEAGPQTLAWSGATDAGGPAASGAYTVRLEAGAERRVKKLTLVR